MLTLMLGRSPPPASVKSFPSDAVGWDASPLRTLLVGYGSRGRHRITWCISFCSKEPLKVSRPERAVGFCEKDVKV